LHGIVSIQVVATPISGFARSSSVKPTAFNIERAPARSGPSVIAALCRFMCRSYALRSAGRHWPVDRGIGHTPGR
jgi:hypothetical protein